MVKKSHYQAPQSEIILLSAPTVLQVASPTGSSGESMGGVDAGAWAEGAYNI